LINIQLELETIELGIN